MDSISFSLVFQGYEPEVFKQAFREGWTPFEKVELIKSIKDVVEESDSEFSGDSD